MKPKPKILLTGSPGVGKTSLVQRVLEKIPDTITKAGFVTVEQSGKKGRSGFTMVTTDGREVPFAYAGRKGKGARVGKYIVDVDTFEEAALEAIAFHAGVELYVIDELGPMECLSRMFCETAKMLLKKENVAVLATVAKSGKGFIREIKRLPGVDMMEVTGDNQPQIEDDVLRTLLTSFVEAREEAENASK